METNHDQTRRNRRNTRGTDVTKHMTGYEQMKHAQKVNRENDLKFIEVLSTNYYNEPEHVAKKAFDKGLAIAVDEIEGWKLLLIKAQAEIPYANPAEAKREHDNTMNLLNIIISKLIRRKIHHPDSL